MEKIISLFKLYLKSQHLSQISSTNYLVDLRNFLEWYILKLTTERVTFTEEDCASLARYFSQERIEDYKNFLLNNSSPIKTINRRLSSLRKFGSFCVEQGWLIDNPTRNIKNSGIKTPAELNEYDHILIEFKNDMLNKSINPITAKNYLVDARQFINFIKAI